MTFLLIIHGDKLLASAALTSSESCGKNERTEVLLINHIQYIITVDLFHIDRDAPGSPC